MQLTNVDLNARYDIERNILAAILNTANNHKMNYWNVNIKQTMFKHGYSSSECFRNFFYRDVYDCILKCWENDLSADILTVSKIRPIKYKSPQLGAFNFDLQLLNITQATASSAHLEHHLFLLKQFIYMDFWNIISNDASRGWEGRDVVDFTEQVLHSANQLKLRYTGSLKLSGLSIADRMAKQWEMAKNGEAVALPFGIAEIDSKVGGFFKTELTIIAARPAMGKTSFILIIALYIAINFKVKVLFFSLEMSAFQLISRIAAIQLGIDYQEVKNNRISVEQLMLMTTFIRDFEANSNLKIIDDCRTLNRITDRIAEEDPGFVVIDYLQRIALDGPTRAGSREQEIALISRTLKDTANDYVIPVVSLAQLSRKVEERKNKRPMMSDLRESGAIEQDADNVWFLYRPAYYLLQEGEYVPKEEQGNVEFIQAKGRESVIDSYRLQLDLEKFEIHNGFAYKIQEQQVKQYLQDPNARAPGPPPPPPTP